MSYVTIPVVLFFFSSLIVIGVAAGLGARSVRELGTLTCHILLGSLAAGALYVLIFYVLLIKLGQRPSLWNLAWFIGIPVFLSILRRPRIPNLALAVPMIFGGWAFCDLVGRALQITADL